MSKPTNDSHARIYQWLLARGASERAVDFQPHDYLRKTGFLATPEGVDRVKRDLVVMEEDGWVVIGQSTAAGHIVMATGKLAETLLLPFERLITMHALMSVEERTMLSLWEKYHLGQEDQLTTTDWPGWRVVIKRLAH